MRLLSLLIGLARTSRRYSMKRRLYYLLPDIEFARQVKQDLRGMIFHMKAYIL